MDEIDFQREALRRDLGKLRELLEQAAAGRPDADLIAVSQSLLVNDRMREYIQAVLATRKPAAALGGEER